MSREIFHRRTECRAEVGLASSPITREAAGGISILYANVRCRPTGGRWIGGSQFYSCPFPSWRERFCRTARSRPGRAVRRGAANPGRRGPFWKRGGGGKRACRRGRFLKRDKRGGCASVSTMILFET